MSLDQPNTIIKGESISILRSMILTLLRYCWKIQESKADPSVRVMEAIQLTRMIGEGHCCHLPVLPSPFLLQLP